jgi:hypothetical protein
MCQRNLGKQLEVDDHVQAAVQQKERGGLSSGQDLADDGDVLQEEGLGLAIRLQPVAYWKLAPTFGGLRPLCLTSCCFGSKRRIAA